MFLSISTKLLATYLHRKYTDLAATFCVMDALASEHIVDAFEFELLAEWNGAFEPVDKDTRFNRKYEWEHSRKHEVGQIARLIRREDYQVASVHANRDVGVLLCSGERALVERGRLLIERAASLAELVDAPLCVLHLWDPWSQRVDFRLLRAVVDEVFAGHPSVTPSVENIPTYTRLLSPFEAASAFPSVTLDLKWADKYGEIDRYRELGGRLRNVHFHGALAGKRWHLSASLDEGELLRRLQDEWRYAGPITLEPEEDFHNLLWGELVAGIRSVKLSTAV
jgi:sugar phosphate isomerase/epimerase